MPSDPQPSAGAKDAAQTPTQASAPDAPSERRYSVDELAAGSRTLFKPGVSPHAVRGALSGERAKTFTAEDAAKKVAKFTGREAEVDEGAG